MAALLERDNGDETRLKARTALRRAITRVACLIVNPSGAHQMVVVEVRFATASATTARLYLLELRRHQPLKVASVAMETLTHDLATPEGVKFFTNYVTDWAEDGWMQPGVGKPVSS